MTSPAPEAPVSPTQKWAITVTVMVVAFMQILDTSVTNVVLPHLQGSLSAGLDEVSWVITSYLAANAVIIPATAWLAGLFGRTRFFLICTTLFVLSSFLSGAAPDLTALIDWWGLGLMVAGFGCLQFVLDRGEREDWFDSSTIVALTLAAVCALAGFLVRELTASDPILDLTVFADRNFATGVTLMSIVGFGMFSGILLVAVFTQKLLGYDAWTSGLVLAPGGLGNVFSLFASGLVTRVDQRLMLAFGCLLNAVSLYMMTSLTTGMDYWALALPRFIQGFAVGFIFVPLSTMTLATVRREKLVNATAVYGMMRNVGGSVGIAVTTTLLAQRSQFHQATLVSHITVWDPATQARLTQWANHFAALGSDTFTAENRAVAMLYRETVSQAQLLAYADDFWLLAMMFAAVPVVLPFMRRIRLEPTSPATAASSERAAHVVEEGAV